MARADLPALHIRPVGDDAVPPQHRKLVRLGIDHPLLELAHQDALFVARQIAPPGGHRAMRRQRNGYGWERKQLGG
jgi:hypothetical protein